MRQECRIIAKSADGKKAIGIDIQNKGSILNYVNQSTWHLKQWKHIVQLIMEGHRNSDLYDKEDIETCKEVTAMKFVKGQENDRIYCKEQNEDGLFLIIMVELFIRKKTKELIKKEIPIIKKIASYEYRIK